MFNAIIAQDQDLYKEDEVDDLVDELYIELADEDFKARKRRIQKIKETLQEQKGKPTGSRRANFCDPMILSWVNAAVKQFPYLILECNKPLYIERAHNFASASYYELLMDVQRGPVRRREPTPENPNAMEPEGDAKRLWTSRAYTLWEFRIVQFGASGNPWYVHDTIDILRDGADKIITDGMVYIRDYYDISTNQVFTLEEMLNKGYKAPKLDNLIDNIAPVFEDEGEP